MKKLLLPMLFIILLLAACSGETDASEETDAPKEKSDVEEHHPESLFTYEFDEDTSLDFTGIESSNNGETILFSLQEKIKRDKERSRFVKMGDKEVVDLKDISEASAEDLEDRTCYRTFISPNGKYITYSCAKDERWFVVYDTEEEKVIHHQEEIDEYGLDLIGITNELEAVSHHKDGNQITILNVETGDTKEYSIPELSGVEEDYYTNFITSEDGKKIFMHDYSQLSVLDTEANTLNKVIDVEPYEERFNGETEGIILDSLRISPNGKYAFFRLNDETSKDKIYQSINFVDVEKDEIHSYTDYDYQAFGTIDNNGNMIIADHDQAYLYDMNNETAHFIPNADIGVYTKYLTLTGDGNQLLYGDRVRDSDETPAYELFRLSINEIDTYETVDVNGTKEDTEELLGAVSSHDNSGDDGIALNPIREDVRAIYKEKWNESAEVPFPSIYPEEVTYISDHIHMDSFGQTIHFDPAEITKRKKIDFSANNYPDKDKKDFCIDKDLELVKTIDNVDYYFYLFSTEDVELAFVKDDWCYALKGKGFTEEEMFTIADSMDTQGKRPEKLPLDEFIFPTALPNKDAEITRVHVSKHKGDNYVFHVEYRGEREEMNINYEITQKEPTYFDHEESDSLELDHSLEASYNEDKLRVYVFDGKYYNIIEADVKNDQIKEMGGKDIIKDALVGIANSLQ